MKRSSSKTAVKWRKESRPYLMLIPAALVLLLISVYPVLYGISDCRQNGSWCDAPGTILNFI